MNKVQRIERIVSLFLTGRPFGDVVRVRRNWMQNIQCFKMAAFAYQREWRGGEIDMRFVLPRIRFYQIQCHCSEGIWVDLWKLSESNDEMLSKLQGRRLLCAWPKLSIWFSISNFPFNFWVQNPSVFPCAIKSWITELEIFIHCLWYRAWWASAVHHSLNFSKILTSSCCVDEPMPLASLSMRFDAKQNQQQSTAQRPHDAMRLITVCTHTPYAIDTTAHTVESPLYGVPRCVVLVVALREIQTVCECVRTAK